MALLAWGKEGKARRELNKATIARGAAGLFLVDHPSLSFAHLPVVCYTTVIRNEAVPGRQLLQALVLPPEPD